MCPIKSMLNRVEMDTNSTTGLAGWVDIQQPCTFFKLS
ncbi:hypothetical protein PBI_SCTP2_404 [Salicola phage SCTP-2]|nr:hypothetical protein PBI_SCTP2_404 [Salicola phage SCTP-2]